MAASPRFVKPARDYDLPAFEEEVLARWRAERIPEQVLSRREGREPYVFYEGPPTANGRPGVHHVFARTLKDVVCRYWTMKGRYVPRKAGWDTHGLPVEIEVQKELGISIKPEIEKYGIGPFNERCRASVFKYKEEWERLSARMGYWLDYDHPYVTCDNAYISSLWSILARFFDEGLLERGHRILPWCPKCGTGLSSHEVAQGYQDVQDPSVFVRFPRVGHPGQSFLVWTTTPWTLPSNVALAVSPKLDYVRVKRSTKEGGSEELILAAALVAKVFGKEKVEILETLSGAALVGERCERPFDWLPFEEGRHEVVVAGDFVSAEDGSGIVHLAPAFGEDDHAVGRAEGLAILNPIDAQGRFAAAVTPVAGVFARDANAELVRELERRGKLFRRDNFTHSYPHCWRCKTPLLYWLRPSWYLRTTRFKEQLVAQNRAIEWFPADIGTGRFGEWLDNNVDWAVSRERYWGTPLNVWACEACKSLQVVRSEAHLRALAPDLPAAFDLHRPHVDAVVLPCAKAGCGGRATRTPEVIDCWFDSGAMPFAQHGWIAEKGKAPPAEHPADYISEGLDQTRGWFYTLHVVSTFLTGKPASKRILVGNLLLDAKKQKMSKSRGNTVDPWQEIDAHGVDAVRWYLLSQSQPWLPKAYDPAAVGAAGRELFGTLWNCWSFFATYAELDGFDPAQHAAPAPSARSELDRWLLAEIERLVEEVDGAFARYDLTRAANLVGAFVDRKLSNWWIRRSRDRFWGRGLDAEKLAAYWTLFEALERVALLLAPIAPFWSEALWSWLKSGAGSIHLESFPTPRAERRAPELERDMEAVLDVVALARRARNAAGINLRQPLGQLFVKGPDAAADGKLGGRYAALLADELNVGSVTIADAARLDELRTLKVKPNFKLLGPKLGSKLGAAKQALEGLDAAQIGTLLRGETLSLEIGGAPVAFTPAEIEVVVQGKTGVCVETDGKTLVALDPTLTPELIAAGQLREIVKRVNNSRREAGLRVSDRIELHLGGAGPLLATARAGAARIGADTLATSVACDGAAPSGGEWKSFPWEVEGDALVVTLRRVAS
ncbi:MAG: isoleucine--tRNA ligase [Planctomycetes bacterium]|nr:isoleucine--tRNA ligase [Planctomycetota bacterium]